MAVSFMPDDLFREVYGTYAKRLSVDVVVIGRQGVALIKRDIMPFIGAWHLPGGSVYRGEMLKDAAKRIVKRELGIDTEVGEAIGSMEFPNEEREIAGEKLFIDTVSIVFVAKPLSEDIVGSKDGKEVAWFTSPPPKDAQLAQHIEFLVEHGLLKP